MIRLKAFTVKNGLFFLIAAVLAVYLYSQSPDAFQYVSGAALQFIRAAALIVAVYILFERLFEMPLHIKILLGMIFGAAAGIFFGSEIGEIKPLGTAFIRAIQMIVVPLVLASLITGTASLGDISKMKRIGSKTLAYYLISTAVAITIGLVLANLLQPGSGMDAEVKARLLESYSQEASSKLTVAQNPISVVDTFLNMIPKNPFEALSGASMLQIIFFSIITGIALTLIPKEKAQPVIAFFDGVNDAMIKIVLLVIETAPYGVLALIAEAVGSFGVDILVSLLKYTVVTALGLLILL
ncbi:MAG: cation:dicarboxylase symporter family transporter, partial [Calditrichaeota bacterium]|nr:cation:dicarboxylase symporter family transporter [Calditrichota bacterium]